MTFFNEATANNIKYGPVTRESPSTNLVEITPSDVTLHLPYLRAFRVGVAGNVAVLTLDDYNEGLTASKSIACASGTDTPIEVVKIFATGTDATNITGYRP